MKMSIFGNGFSHEYGVYMERLLHQLIHEQAEFQAEITRLEKMDVETFVEHLHAGNFKEFENILVNMNLTSTNTGNTLKSIHGVNMAASHSADTEKAIKNIDKIIKMCLSAEKESMAFADRLPLTLGKGGWMGAGDETLASAVRKMINIPGYLLIEGAGKIIGEEKRRALHNLYMKSVYDFRRTLVDYQAHVKNKGELVDLGNRKDAKAREHLLKAVRDAIKEFRHYMRISRRVGRKYRRLQKDVNRLIKKERLGGIRISVEDVKSYSSDSHANGAKYYARRA